ncbi:KAT8 regulatory NSL complex subunit 3 [Impatiens glandulifera]|uniref:KAT8 regulatory NSL complex subunit 3 n=1 Tax=Impatiens glandulifera TaxID=253017 RepID=UPI001FB0646F|nr:KAT8 regulatory NSL complex subunit 3 [Impatiens glandulifera]
MAPSTRSSKRQRRNEKERDEYAGELVKCVVVNEPIDGSGDQPEITKEVLRQKGLGPLVVFAHGAGAPSCSEWMTRWKEMLAKGLSAVEVVTFDYPYLSGGKRGPPPKAEKLVEFHADIVRKAVGRYPGHPLVLFGKSMGSRVSCMVSDFTDINVSAIVCLGYPLKGSNGAVRDEILLKLTIPTLFIQGSKDGLCPLQKLEAVRKKMKAVNSLHEIMGGDHSFKIGKKQLQTNGSTQEEAEDQAVHAIAMFLSRFV